MEDETLSFQYEKVDFAFEKPEVWADWLCDVAEYEGFDLDGMTYIFCTDEFLLDINKKFLNHDYYTDIITFPIELEEDDILAADIFISLDRIKENAKTFEVTFERELARVMVHGLLHLCGFDDHAPDDKKKMREKEDFHLLQFMAED